MSAPAAAAVYMTSSSPGSESTRGIPPNRLHDARLQKLYVLVDLLCPLALRRLSPLQAHPRQGDRAGQDELDTAETRAPDPHLRGFLKHNRGPDRDASSSRKARPRRLSIEAAGRRRDLSRTAPWSSLSIYQPTLPASEFLPPQQRDLQRRIVGRRHHQ